MIYMILHTEIIDMYEVYLIENTVNDKLYVGVTSIGLHDR